MPNDVGLGKAADPFKKHAFAERTKLVDGNWIMDEAIQPWPRAKEAF